MNIGMTFSTSATLRLLVALILSVKKKKIGEIAPGLTLEFSCNSGKWHGILNRALE